MYTHLVLCLILAHRSIGPSHHLCFNINTGDKEIVLSHCWPCLNLPPYPPPPVAPSLMIQVWCGQRHLQKQAVKPPDPSPSCTHSFLGSLPDLSELIKGWGTSVPKSQVQGLHLHLHRTTATADPHMCTCTPNHLSTHFFLETFNYEVENLSEKWADQKRRGSKWLKAVGSNAVFRHLFWQSSDFHHSEKFHWHIKFWQIF